MRSFFLVCLLTLGVAAGGCGSATTTQIVPSLPQAMPVDPPGGSYMLTANTYAGDALNAMLLLRMSSAGGILTTSFVNIHDLEQTSAFGRVASQQVGSRLGQHGFRVLEARLASTLSMVPRNGEFMLTREAARLLADTYDAGAVLVGTYSDEGGSVFVSARVVRLADNAVMAAYEYVLPRDGDVGSLLASGYQGGFGGDFFWGGNNSNRTPAFPGGMQSLPSYTSPAVRGSGQAPNKTASAKAPVPAKSGASSTATQSGGADVPRYVDPAAKAAAAPAPKAPTSAQARRAAPVAKAPAEPIVAPAGPAPVAPAVVPMEKDSPAPSSVPGGAPGGALGGA